MKLKALSLSDCEQAREWRNSDLSMNRTPFLLTPEMQSKFYQEVICNRQANARYWGIWEEIKKECDSYFPNLSRRVQEEMPKTKTTSNIFIGMGEITNISLENRNGEIGLLMHSGYTYIAEQAIDLILKQGFNYLNLDNIYGEVYECSAYYDLWKGIYRQYGDWKPTYNHPYSCECGMIKLPNRKYWQGKYYSSLYFNVNREVWKECINLSKT
jgi:hypothetical protein